MIRKTGRKFRRAVNCEYSVFPKNAKIVRKKSFFCYSMFFFSIPPSLFSPQINIFPRKQSHLQNKGDEFLNIGILETFTCKKGDTFAHVNITGRAEKKCGEKRSNCLLA